MDVSVFSLQLPVKASNDRTQDFLFCMCSALASGFWLCWQGPWPLALPP